MLFDLYFMSLPVSHSILLVITGQYYKTSQDSYFKKKIKRLSIVQTVALE